jgi:hypothetical protein
METAHPRKLYDSRDQSWFDPTNHRHDGIIGTNLQRPIRNLQGNDDRLDFRAAGGRPSIMLGQRQRKNMA